MLKRHDCHLSRKGEPRIESPECTGSCRLKISALPPASGPSSKAATVRSMSPRTDWSMTNLHAPEGTASAHIELKMFWQLQEGSCFCALHFSLCINAIGDNNTWHLIITEHSSIGLRLQLKM